MHRDEPLQEIFADAQRASSPSRQLPIIDMTRMSRAEKVDVQIENVVAIAALNQHLDLNAILEATPGARYNPERFSGLVYKLQKPRTTTLLFHSGKMVCTGAKTTRSANNAITQVVSQLKNLGIVILAPPEVRVENIVASADLNTAIDLESVAERLFSTLYEPEQFPALIFRMKEPKAVFLVFANGKVICTGGKSEREVHIAVNQLNAILQSNGLLAACSCTAGAALRGTLATS